MAQIITLKDMKSRNTLSRASHDTARPLGPAQLLFFTGVRYERYGETQQTDTKLTAKTSRKRRLQN